jgi:hypothetical protein
MIAAVHAPRAPTRPDADASSRGGGRRGRDAGAPAAVSRYQRPVTGFYAKVAGVTYDNRQAAIVKLTPLEPLELVPEPGNRADSNAIKVCRRTGEQIGYLRRARARPLAEKLSRGHRCAAFVKRVSGGETHYVSITVLVMSPGATDQQVVDWINRCDVLRGITLSVSSEGRLVASRKVDLAPDVTVRARQPSPLTILFHDPNSSRPDRQSFRGWPAVVLLILVLIIVLVLLSRNGGG